MRRLGDEANLGEPILLLEFTDVVMEKMCRCAVGGA